MIYISCYNWAVKRKFGAFLMPAWTFITNHGAVLAFVAKHPRITARALSTQLGITERSVLRIIGDLEAEGYLERSREGRTNLYEVNPDLSLRRPELADSLIGDLLEFLDPQTQNG
jgi:DNA-binding transcriptional ArsR family regulator